MWDAASSARAAQEGWRLITTIDNGTAHPYFDVAACQGKFRSDAAAQLFVIDAARSGSKFHINALSLVVNSRVRKPRKKR